MGQLADLQRQLTLASGGVVEPTDADRLAQHVAGIVEAIQGVDLTESQSQDYSDALKAIADALTGGLDGHTKALAKALGKIEVNPQITVESPPVTVEAPIVNVENEFSMPEQGPIEFTINRDTNGYMQSVIARPYEEPEKPKKSYTVE